MAFDMQHDTVLITQLNQTMSVYNSHATSLAARLTLLGEHYEYFNNYREFIISECTEKKHLSTNERIAKELESMDEEKSSYLSDIYQFSPSAPSKSLV